MSDGLVAKPRLWPQDQLVATRSKSGLAYTVLEKFLAKLAGQRCLGGNIC